MEGRCWRRQCVGRASPRPVLTVHRLPLLVVGALINAADNVSLIAAALAAIVAHLS